MNEWHPMQAEVRWAATQERRPDALDGERWPEQVELIAWERSEEGETRIKARKSYRVVNDDGT